jgi:hypothetical protein
MRALVVATVVASACGTGGIGDDEPGGSTAAHRLCVDETNRYRALHGRPDVAWSAALEAYADEGAEYDHGATPHAHFTSTGGGGIAFAENECPRWNLSFGGGDVVDLVAACIAAFYDEGPGGGHYEILLGDYGSLGCGIYQSANEVTIVQDYGR